MKLLLVDGLNLVRRIFSAGYSDQASPDEESTQRLVRTCTQSLKRALELHRPTHVAVVFENAGPTWRHELYPDYKKSRKPMPDALEQAMPEIILGLEEVGARSLRMDGYEADDVIASVASRVAAKNGNVVILSTDRLLCQLLEAHIVIHDHFNQRDLDRDYVLDRFGVEPQLIPDLLGLAGDSGVDVPGIPSVGIKTAARLIHEYGDLESVLSHAGEISGRTGDRLREHRQAAITACELFTLKTDIVLGVNLQDFRVPDSA